tara:strand:- start:1526 stop:2221 length:696 start_codon:yes stop_codon:yes gene_type:complete
MITKLSSQQPEFEAKLSALLRYEGILNKQVTETVDEIISSVRSGGDKSLIDYSVNFDNVNAKSLADLTINPKDIKSAYKELEDVERKALDVAAERIEQYHQKQKQSTWTYTDEDGSILGQKITPLDRVGLYVPGGKAAYPSSVLMNAIPAKVAGVRELIMVVPTPNGQINQLVLASAYISGVNKIFTIGGAQAIAALAYGTESVPKVDKIVGPGNLYVATAKRAVFGQCWH